MFALSAPLAAVQGEPAVELCCKLLSPAVFFVSVLAVVRGYFQGRREMLPTALTEICEQLLKVTAGVAFALYFKNNMPLATACTLLAVTVSEALSSLFALIMYRGESAHFRPLYSPRPTGYRQILRYTATVTLSAVAMPRKP